MSFNYIVGDIKSQDKYENERYILIKKYGSAFQTPSWCQVFETTWKGIYYPRHITVFNDNRIVAIIPAYLYKSCPRVDYYKKACTDNVVNDLILLSHALVGWYGFPVAESEHDKEMAIRYFSNMAKEEKAIAMFAGIDGRDKVTIEVLQKNGFTLKRFHTLMVRDLTNISEEDPTSVLPRKQRHQVRKRLNLAQKAGTTIRFATSIDYNTIVKLISGILREMGTPPEVLPEEFISQLLKKPVNCLENIVAVDENDKPIGVHLHLLWGKVYSLWLGGHDRKLLNKYYQSHLLYETSIKRAIELGCSEIQAGRDPYEIKKQHGFKPVPILCAVQGSNVIQHQRATQWISSLEKRHFIKYPDLKIANKL